MGEGGGSREMAVKKGVLGDITNINGKRRLSLDLETNAARHNVGRKGGGLKDASFDEQAAGDARASMKRKDKIDGVADFLVDGKGKGLYSFDSRQPCQLVTSDSKGIFLYGVTEVDKLGQGYGDFESVPAHCDKSSETNTEDDCLEDDETDSADSFRYSFRAKNDVSKSTASNCTGLHFAEVKESNVDSGEAPSNVPLGKSGFSKCLKLSGSPNIKVDDGPDKSGFSKCSKLSRSSDIKVDDGSDPINGISNCIEISMPEKSCKCSFCLKAAYMWADLHYQDARGRLAALKKSKRLARTLEVRSCSNNHNIKAIQQSTKRSSELEFELTQQWRSLFLRTENTLVLETAQLHANFLRLKELREICKRDLEAISMVPSDK
ncbi:hypothetical protein MUK42_25149 [Musa troglodytarum]|uniref:Uncharacterized protein n=1 Tax=Musa troglodytarum TaxID=320322 RepID=A0A9E7L4G1_9LILI|nr:hypothetical protein MUK42_25149 [Musa troglodytarum]URE45623.1 hypothetical protein MUK42_25149 [Musa troglodytarum]URE45624.1 hypothetical protein MUK42_25149 [Musa troglodytarum]